jgi:hypothetical protein
MKYARLSKEQFASLHEEFSFFLASQSIDKKQWAKIKKENPILTDDLLDLFSDMVWDISLEKITFLENRSDHHLFLFKCLDNCIDLILIQLDASCPSLKEEDYKNWLAEHWTDPKVSFFESSRKFYQDFKKEKFKLVRQGALVIEGTIFEDIKKNLSK